jgi:hypothetical protein
VIGTFTPGSTNYDSYTTNSFTVTAGAHLIKFVGLDPDGLDNTAFIDQATINTVVPILTNAGFENPNVGAGNYQYNPSGSGLGWTFDTSSGVTGNNSAFTSGNPNAPEGNQVAFLQGYGTISQTATFAAAGTYKINFMAAQRVNGNFSSQTIQVLVDGVVVGYFTPSTTNNGTYTSFTASFTVTAGTHTITFAGSDPDGQDNTAFIDQVQVQQ